MSIGLSLQAEMKDANEDAEAFLHDVSLWLQREYEEFSPQTKLETVEGLPTLFCELHPTGEPLELSVPDAHHVTVFATTSCAGPGYHIFVCNLLQKLARNFRAEWLVPDRDGDYGDDAEYFFTGKQENVFEHMNAWLRSVTGTFFEGGLEEDFKNLALCMPMNVHFDGNGLAVTPLGPRDREWLLKTSQGAPTGKEFFAWWTSGMNAEYYLGRALGLMWSEVRWRKPLNEPERRVLKEVADSLRTAKQLDPSLSYPWPEWMEVLNLLELEADKALITEQLSNPSTIGYRRRDVTVQLPGGWSLRLPGSFSDFESDNEGNFFALDPPREIWFTAYSFKENQPRALFESRLKQVLENPPELLQRGENYVASAKVVEKVHDSGERYFLLQSSNQGLNTRSVCTILFEDYRDRAWAESVWRSLNPENHS